MPDFDAAEEKLRLATENLDAGLLSEEEARDMDRFAFARLCGWLHHGDAAEYAQSTRRGGQAVLNEQEQTYRVAVRFQRKQTGQPTELLLFVYSINEEKEALQVSVNDETFTMSNTQFLRFFAWMRQLPYDKC